MEIQAKSATKLFYQVCKALYEHGNTVEPRGQSPKATRLVLLQTAARASHQYKTNRSSHAALWFFPQEQRLTISTRLNEIAVPCGVSPEPRSVGRPHRRVKSTAPKMRYRARSQIPKENGFLSQEPPWSGCATDQAWAGTC